MRCAFDAGAPKVWEQPGQLDRFFERIVVASNYSSNITVLSGPADRIRTLKNVSNTSAIPDGPWILSIENFLSDDECEHLIRMGERLGYERSLGLKRQKDGSERDEEVRSRTSSNTWCMDECYEHPETRQIAERVQELTGHTIPEANCEHWQLLKYDEGQEYREHSDYIKHQLERAEGVRILTIFFYLNTAEGGGTRFPRLNDLTVEPVRGRAVLWPSVLNESPDGPDERTNHQAMPAVTTKYGANVWMHQRDFQTPFEQDCQ